MAKLFAAAALAAMFAFHAIAPVAAEESKDDHSKHHEMTAGGGDTSKAAPSAGATQGAPGAMMMGDCPMMRGMMGGGMAGGGMGGGMMGGGMMGGGMMGAMSQERLAAIKTELKITDAQATAWDGYAAAKKAQGEAMKANRETMMKNMGEGTAVTKIEAHISAMEKMLAALKTLKGATETLYATLDEGQKKAADKALGHGCMM